MDVPSTIRPRVALGRCVLQKDAEDLQADNDKKEGRTKVNRQVEESDRKRRDWRIGPEAAETSTAVWPTIPFRFFTETEATARRLRRRAMKPNLSRTPVETSRGGSNGNGRGCVLNLFS